MSNQKEMTRAEIKEALKCFVRYNLAFILTRDERQEVCENCSYIDFCWSIGEIIKQKPKKYL